MLYECFYYNKNYDYRYFLYGTLNEFDSFCFLMKYTQTKKRFVIIILTSA